MIFVVLFGLAVATVPLAGGKLRELSHLRLRRWRVLAAAFVLQLIALKAPLPHDFAAGLNLSTYFLGAWYLVANLAVPGMWLVCAGTVSNVLALLANGGVMPAAPGALAKAGLPAVTGGGFVNSTIVANPKMAFLGDVFAIPRSVPFHNVFSIGDVLIFLGGVIALHRLCRSRLLPPPNPEFARLRQNRSFVALWTAQGVSNLGDWVYTIAVATSMAGRHGSAAIFATLMLMQVGPAALMGAFGGPLVDRLPRRAVMVAADLGRGLAVASLFLTHAHSTPHLFAVAALLGVLGALANPALQASLPNVVHPDDLVAANSLVAATFNAGVMVGPVIGGLLVARLGFSPAIVLNGASFLGSALLVSRVALPPQPPSDERWSPLAEVREGARYIAGSPLIRVVMVVMGLVMFGAALKSPIEPVFVLQVLHGRPETLGLVGGAWGVGMVLGSVMAPGATRAWTRERMLWVAVGVVGVAVLGAAQAHAVAPVLVLWVVAGCGNALGSICYETLLQERTPDHLRGRILAASEAVLDAALLLGYVVAGWVGTHAGTRGTLSLAGLSFVVGALLCWGKLGRPALAIPEPVPVAAPIPGWEGLGFTAVPLDAVEAEPSRACPTCEWLGLSADDCCLDLALVAS